MVSYRIFKTSPSKGKATTSGKVPNKRSTDGRNENLRDVPRRLGFASRLGENRRTEVASNFTFFSRNARHRRQRAVAASSSTARSSKRHSDRKSPSNCRGNESPGSAVPVYPEDPHFWNSRKCSWLAARDAACSLSRNFNRIRV